MCAADQRPGFVKSADSSVQKRTRTFGRSRSGAETHGFAPVGRESGQSAGQGKSFDLKEGEMPAAGVTTGAAGQIFTAGVLDLPAEGVDALLQGIVVAQRVQWLNFLE
jgi:hypothetical protein